jgi:hypothetical protein
MTTTTTTTTTITALVIITSIKPPWIVPWINLKKVLSRHTICWKETLQVKGQQVEQQAFRHGTMAFRKKLFSVPSTTTTSPVVEERQEEENERSTVTLSFQREGKGGILHDMENESR